MKAVKIVRLVLILFLSFAIGGLFENSHAQSWKRRQAEERLKALEEVRKAKEEQRQIDEKRASEKRKREDKLNIVGAVLEGDYSKVESLIFAGGNIEMRRAGKTPLLYACEKGNLDIVKLLIEFDADVNAKEERNREESNDHDTKLFNYINLSCLAKAVYGGNNKIVELLIKNGARGIDDLLLYACKKGNIEEVRLLVGLGANVNQYLVNPEYTTTKTDHSLYYALNGELKKPLFIIELAQILLKKGATVFADSFISAFELENYALIELLVNYGGIGLINQRYDKKYPITVLLKKNATPDNIKILNFLISHGVNLDIKSRGDTIFTPMRYSFYEKEYYNLIASAKFDPNIYDGEGRTALMWAAKNGHVKLVKGCLANGAKVNLRAKQDGNKTALLMAIEKDHSDVVKILLAHESKIRGHEKVDIELEAGVKHGWTPLYTAMLRSERCGVLLIEAGVDVNKPVLGYSTRFPLNIAIESKKYAFARRLINAGAKPNNKTYEKTALLYLLDKYDEHYKNEEDFLTLIELLLKNGADVNARGDTQVGDWARHEATALMQAAEIGSYQAVKLLLEYGANTELEDSKGETALRYAIRGGNTETINIIREYRRKS